jgi:hippurate hydrolase
LLKDKAISVSELQNGGGRVETSANSKGLGSAGSEDFAYVSQRVPSVMLALAAGEADKGYCYPQHHPKTMFDESVLSVGAAVYAYSAMRWLQEHER